MTAAQPEMAGQLRSLPELVRRYAERVLPREPGAGRTVRIAQVGEMVPHARRAPPGLHRH
jgi:hypothetical protein